MVDISRHDNKSYVFKSHSTGLTCYQDNYATTSKDARILSKYTSSIFMYNSSSNISPSMDTLLALLFNSMPDLSIPEIVKQFNERQTQKYKQKKRPHSSAVYSTKNTAGKQGKEKATDSSYKAFITGSSQLSVLL